MRNLLAWILVPIALGFVAWLLVSAEWQSITEPPSHASRAAAVAEALPMEASIRLLFTGDVMFDRGIALYAAKNGVDSIFAGVKDLLGSEDAVIMNLETTLTTNDSVSAKDRTDLRFTSDPAFAELLRSLGVRAVSLSNNHTDDFGDRGLIETRNFLSNAGIAYFGAPDNIDGLSTVLTVRNKHACFIGYEGFIRTDPTPIATEITRIRPGCDLLIATMHAGEEYQLAPTPLQQNAAHAFIDAGADIVIGTHPHVVQPLEMYKGNPIFYSLGNFVFDQDFSWETEHGIAVKTVSDDAHTTVSLIPIDIRNGRVSITSEGEDIVRTLTALGTTTGSFEIRK